MRDPSLSPEKDAIAAAKEKGSLAGASRQIDAVIRGVDGSTSFWTFSKICGVAQKTVEHPESLRMYAQSEGS
jgi:hypothetical protein